MCFGASKGSVPIQDNESRAAHEKTAAKGGPSHSAGCSVLLLRVCSDNDLVGRDAEDVKGSACSWQWRF